MRIKMYYLIKIFYYKTKRKIILLFWKDDEMNYNFKFLYWFYLTILFLRS